MSAEATPPKDAPLLCIRDLQIEFSRHDAAPVKAVKGISLELKRGESIALVGESGSGKELVARRLHEKSNRAEGPFIEVNCAAIPSELIESELFGHEKRVRQVG